MSPGVLSDEARRTLSQWRAAGQKIVFTNGVFDHIVEGKATACATGQGGQMHHTDPQR